MTNVNWTTSQGIGTVLAYYELPNDIINLSAIKKCKLQYNQFMKADIVFRLEAAPISFQAGRLWLAFESYRTQRGARATYGLPITFTALPGIAYDPAKPAPAELRIPFASILSSWDLPIGQYGQGTFLLYVLSPLNSGSTTLSTTLSLQAWFENTELAVPCDRPLQNAPSRSLPLSYIENDSMKFQASEESLAQSHRFSTQLSRLGRVASFFGNFPLLSSVATPVAFFANMASSVAAHFGFSKPNDSSNPTKIIHNNRFGWTNGDGPIAAQVLAVSQDNALDNTAQHMPNPIDEMDIAYICSQMAMVNQWNWATTDPVGKAITVLPIHPGLSTTVSGPGTYTKGTYATTHMGYLATMFRYWAGSISIKMEAVATPFHAGRLVLAYLPSYDPFYSYTINDVGNNYSVVWDITDSSTLNFQVPYCGNTPYLSCMLDDQSFTRLTNGETTGFGPRDRIRKVCNGAIVVFVLNQLVAPSAASTNISVMNWYGGGPDIAFSEPQLGSFKAVEIGAVRTLNSEKFYDRTAMDSIPYNASPARQIQDEEVDEGDLGHFISEEEMASMTFQSAPTNLTVAGTDPTSGSTGQTIAFANFIPGKMITPQERARQCNGEVITNLRILIKRLTPVYAMYPQSVTEAGAWIGTGTAQPPTAGGHVLCIDPDYFGTGDGQDDTAIYNKQFCKTRAGGVNWLTELESSLTYVGRMYNFARGSRLFSISARPSAIVNGAPFTTLKDEARDQSIGTFDLRISHINIEDAPPRAPFFRPDDQLLGYNFANTSSSTLSTANYSFGFNSYLHGNPALEKSDEMSVGAVVRVPPGSKYPFKLLATNNKTEVNMTAALLYSSPRSRRCLEIRYRPFSSAIAGGTTHLVPEPWPMPLTIYEAAADDFTFGTLMPPPLVTQVAPTIMLPNAAGELKLF